MAENHNAEFQGELFPEFKASKTGRLRYLKSDISIGKKIALVVPWENAVFFFIIMVMLLALFFSIGVEKGKRLAVAGSARQKAVIHVSTPMNDIVRASEQAASNTSDGAKARLTREPSAGDSLTEEKKDSFYTIQVMALKSDKDARREAARLSVNGRAAFTVPSGGWHQVCLGKYKTSAGAVKDLEKIRLKYPNSYVRQINN